MKNANEEEKLISLNELSQFKYNDFTNEPVLNKTISTDSFDSSSSEKKEEKTQKTETAKVKIQTNQPLTLWLKISYSIPSFSKMACLLILNVNALIFYETKGANLIYISFFTALARCVELFLKPIIAYSSDNNIYRKGRRKPYMLFGCGFYAVFLVLIFYPPNAVMSPTSISFYFGIFYVLFFIADTVCNIPYLAVGPELSIDPKEREQLYLSVFCSQYLGVLMSSIGPVLIQRIISKCDCSYCDFRTSNNEYAQCLFDCNSKCSVQSNETSLLYVCMAIGFIYVASILILSSLYRENKTSFKSNEQSYIVPTIYRIINNKPFLGLLFPYIIDILITQILATMLPFFITYIIQPREYCRETGKNLSSWQCNPTSWLGAMMFTFFVCSLFIVFGWHFYVGKIGKVKAWKSYSAICVICFSLFIFCGKGNMILMTIFCGLVSIPASGAYLNDVLLTDTIDYDEFISGKRNEGCYMVFSSFIPKLVGIAAQSIPLTIMSLLGFVSSKNGVEYPQPKSITVFIRIFLIIFPVVLSCISFYLKTKYPIDDKKMSQLSKAIGFQNVIVRQINNKVNFFCIKNPIYDTEQIQILPISDIQKDTVFLAEHLYDEDYIKKIINNDLKSVYKIKLLQMGFWILVFIVFIVILGMTFNYLKITSLNMLPLFSLIIATLAKSFIVLIIIQLYYISKYLRGEKKLDLNYLKILLYKIQKEKIQETKNEENGIKYECAKIISECDN